MNKNQQLAQVLASNARKPSKYRAVRCEVDGEKFDSQKEERRWMVLRMLVRAGTIRDLERQRKYPLAVRDNCIGYYVADFTYRNLAKQVVIEDCKGFRTPLYRWKKKHVEAQYGITILET